MTDCLSGLVEPDHAAHIGPERDQTRHAHLLIDIGNILLPFAVHVENLKKGFVDAFVIRKACLQDSTACQISRRRCLESHNGQKHNSFVMWHAVAEPSIMASASIP